MEIRYLILGDKVVVVEFGNEILEDINKKVILFMRVIEILNFKGIVIEMVLIYRLFMISYNLLEIDFDSLIENLKKIEDNLESIVLLKFKIYEILVCYDEVFGIDIKNVVSYNNFIVDEVIKIYISREYLIYMLGFIFGFLYLGGMDERIVIFRLEVLRIKIYGGSVGIVGF